MATVEWIKSTVSNPSGDCVELARLPDGRAAVRNSRFPDATPLVFTRQEVAVFLLGAKAGEFDCLVSA